LTTDVVFAKYFIQFHKLLVRCSGAEWLPEHEEHLRGFDSAD
jgi:hypothetical protein